MKQLVQKIKNKKKQFHSIWESVNSIAMTPPKGKDSKRKTWVELEHELGLTNDVELDQQESIALTTLALVECNHCLKPLLASALLNHLGTTI
jgi:isopentenyldiphosphate isomerase